MANNMFYSGDERAHDQLKPHYKVLEFLNKAIATGAYKVDSEFVVKVVDGQSVDDIVCPPSTSTQAIERSASPESSVSLNLRKRKFEEEDLKMRATSDDKCTHCDCRMLRVVDPGRPDGEKILECTRATCLASVKFTDLPVGTVIGNEPNAKPLSIYNRLDQLYPDEDVMEDSDTEDPPIFEMTHRSICIDVPGQEAKARIQG